MFFRFFCAVTLLASVSPAVAESRYTLEDQILGFARSQNPEVLIAASRSTSPLGNVITAKSGSLPALRTDGYYQERQQTLQDKWSHKCQPAAGLHPDRRADAEHIFLRGRAGPHRHLRCAGEQIAVKNYQAAIETMTLNVKLAFYRVLFADSSLKVRREAVNFYESQLRDQQDRLKAGTVGSLNVSRAQVTLSNERPLLYQAEAERATAYLQLAQVMGVNLSPGQRRPDFVVLGSLVHVQRRFSLAECLARAAANRPEIEVRRLDILALENQVTVEKSATRPQVNAFGAYQLFSQPNPALSPDYFSGFTVGVNFSWTLFDGLATPGRVHSVTARISAARQALRATELAVDTEVRSGFESLRQAEETIRSQQENSALALESLALATGNFNAGLATQLDLLQGQVDLTRARLLAVAGRYGYLNAVARIERAMSANDQKVVVPDQGAIQR